MTDLISHIPHPHEVLAHANAQHAQLLAAIRKRDAPRALGIVSDHLHGTEHILAGPDARRVAAPAERRNRARTGRLHGLCHLSLDFRPGRLVDSRQPKRTGSQTI